MWDFACFAFAVALFALAAVHAHRRGELFPAPLEAPRAPRRASPEAPAVAASATPTPVEPRAASNVVFLGGARTAVAARRHG